jgi:DNA-3-methyladenine glycosylase II
MKKTLFLNKLENNLGFQILMEIHHPKRPQGFETLVLLILEQQVSINSAKATFMKLKKKIPFFTQKIFLLFQTKKN